MPSNIFVTFLVLNLCSLNKNVTVLKSSEKLGARIEVPLSVLYILKVKLVLIKIRQGCDCIRRQVVMRYIDAQQLCTDMMVDFKLCVGGPCA